MAQIQNKDNARVDGACRTSALRAAREPRRAALCLTVALALLWPACSHQTASSGEVWAEVDGKPIYRDQVERYYHGQALAASEAGGDQQALSLKLNVLNELIDNQLLLAHADRSRITVSPGDVDTKLAQLRSPYTAEEFQKKLKDQGMTEEDLRQQIRESLIIDKVLNKDINSHLNITDSDMAEYYKRNKASFDVAETQYHLAQILVTPVRDPQVRNLKNDDAVDAASARRKIETINRQLRAGQDFAALAQAYSEDPRTASGGGDMGFVPASALVADPAVRSALGSLKVGQMSGVIRDSRGNYRILKVLGLEKAGQRDLSDPQVQTAIRQTLMSQKEQLLKAAYIEDLRNRAKIVDYLAARIVAAGGNPHSVN